jgi:hypothetical protein
MTFPRSLFLLLFLLAFAGIGRADAVPLDSVPGPVMQVVNQEKGDGVVVSAETFDWGNMVVYKIVVELKGIPDMEFQISESGKVIRIDHLQEKPDEDPDPDDL